MPLVLQLLQVVWALDLRLHYSDSMAMFQLTRYVTQGHFNAKHQTFSINPPKTQKRQRRRRLAGVEEEVGSHFKLSDICRNPFQTFEHLRD